MKILFTAPRFHTNQVPIVKGLIEKGHKVRFFVAFVGAVEDHRLSKPVVLKPSKYTIHEKKRLLRTKNESDVESIIAGHFIPNYEGLIESFLSYMPDVVICREKTYFTLCVFSLCHEHQIPCILYDQEPVYPIRNKEENKKKTGGDIERILKRIEKRTSADLKRVYQLRTQIGFPTLRMTPVEYARLPCSLSVQTPSDHTFFIPFAAEVHSEASRREYCENGTYHFLSVGKFRDYKNLRLVVKAVLLLNKRENWKVTLIGQVSNHDEQVYYDDILQMIRYYDLTDRFQIKTNIPYDQIGKEYLEHDVFILPSKKEKASISILEAMSYGLPVISTDCNGTASYIVEGETGLIFSSGNEVALAKKMEEIMRINIKIAGRKALEIVRSKYSFIMYYNRFLQMIDEAKNGEQG